MERRKEMAPPPASDAASETASEPEGTPAPSPKVHQKTIPAKKGRLGQIGGQAKGPEAETATSSAHQEPRRRIGAIGKRPAAAPVSPRPDEDGDDRTDEKDAADDEKPCETASDRADRRRQELRKELDRKAATGPAKKKRKF